jgi:4-hydroxy-tetrahydrodipicolinate reductase
MKLALIGHGKMGRTVEKLALEQGHEIVRRFWDVEPLMADSETRKQLKDVSVLIDFSTGDAVFDNVRSAVELSLPLVEGTTGWQDRLGEVQALVRKGGIGFVYASNFSLGVNLFYKLVDRAGQLISAFRQYDPFIEESHHKFKKDAPSGTAIEMRSILEKYYGPSSVPVASLRAGYIPGRHSAGFDSTVDTIKLEHEARGREGLAEGALLASKWIIGRKGFHHFSDVLDEMLAEKKE